MGLARKKRHIETNYKPLQVTGGIDVVGSVPAIQTYSADTKEYLPDYTLTPLVLLPVCHAVDANTFTVNGDVNVSLVNMKWYEQIGGTKTLIATTNTNYEITQSGDNKGQIKMKKNRSPLNPVTLLFYAEYIDVRTNQVYTYQYSQLVQCKDATPATPQLYIDSPETVDWNPIRDILRQTITAKLIVADLDVTATSKCKLFFYRVLANGTLELVGTDGDNDWEVVSLTKNVLVIDRDYIGDEQTYVVKATYDAGGNPASAPPTSSPTCTTRIVRRIPQLECDWKGVTTGVPNGTKTIYPHALVYDTKGAIPQSLAQEWLKPVWWTKAAGASSFTEAATGWSPSIPFSEGMTVELEIQDRGSQCVLVDADNETYLTDADDDTFLFVRENS